MTENKTIPKKTALISVITPEFLDAEASFAELKELVATAGGEPSLFHIIVSFPLFDDTSIPHFRFRRHWSPQKNSRNGKMQRALGYAEEDQLGRSRDFRLKNSYASGQ